MANTTSKVDNLDICTAIVNINGVAAANIKAMNVWDKKTCCTANGPVSISVPQDNCTLACASEDCTNYYTSGTHGTCPLVNGDYLYTDANCTLAQNGYYSPKNCNGGCGKCYSVSSGVITVSDCPSEPTCTKITLAYDASRSACFGRTCKSYYTDGTIGSLTTGDHIYTDSGCEECAASGNYSDRPCKGAQGQNYVVGESCVIIAVLNCG
jgi:hypothetical protein